MNEAKNLIGTDFLTWREDGTWFAAWVRRDIVARGETEDAAVTELTHTIAKQWIVMEMGGGSVADVPVPPDELVARWREWHAEAHGKEVNVPPRHAERISVSRKANDLLLKALGQRALDLDAIADALGVPGASAEECVERIKAIRESLAWCGGSPSFAPGGEAHDEWRRVVVPLLRDKSAALAPAGPLTPIREVLHLPPETNTDRIVEMLKKLLDFLEPREVPEFTAWLDGRGPSPDELRDRSTRKAALVAAAAVCRQREKFHHDTATHYARMCDDLAPGTTSRLDCDRMSAQATSTAQACAEVARAIEDLADQCDEGRMTNG